MTGPLSDGDTWLSVLLFYPYEYLHFTLQIDPLKLLTVGKYYIPEHSKTPCIVYIFSVGFKVRLDVGATCACGVLVMP